MTPEQMESAMYGGPKAPAAPAAPPPARDVASRLYGADKADSTLPPNPGADRLA